MNIGFFGHSVASWFGENNQTKSFISQIQESLGASIVNLGVPQGSEERILFDLKKCKELHLAVIFHSVPKYYFLPKCQRDISIDSIPSNKAEIFWSETGQPSNSERFDSEFMSYGKIREVFGDKETFVNTMKSAKEFLHHPDLQMNRYQGALSLIDSFCKVSSFRTIHIPIPKFVPSWFVWQSGEVHPELLKIPIDYHAPGINPNNLSNEGNAVMAQALLEIIRQP